ncbi:pyruvate:ferredoxin (flavodoxin) oxidoreductase [Acetivibrio straminisolvens]|jgi:pyruvate-ferredoxin/flavodoxin oxidoreductase|uniref:pyruvate:ferredoxin (flavodoxin) oxidoreductase n=1 Tax=Acetivibrio straminisolvens TaxID=253314 RepID=UPI0022405CEC|nr:pyruvate:ferredoxin (flavodoxin) oxidoreductase [Acetivibrio straminisolvens]
MQKFETMDGNQAAAYASYAFTDVAAIYPITPSSPMAETVDEWAAHEKKNIFGQPVRVVQMQSEAGAAGAMHGSLAAGALTTTYTASQGLLLMIPNLYKMAGELLPGVLHVSARAIATHALSIFGDHQDVMACRQTGVALLASSNVQEAADLGYVAHLSAIKSRIPFIHFFDGFRTSHENQKIGLIEYDELAKLVDYNAIKEFRDRALNPEHPVARGTAQNPDIYFQGREVQNKFYDSVPDIVASYMQEIKRITGREYRPFDYYGAKDAEYVIVAMGSICDTIDETIDYLMAKGEKVGAVRVHLYRPFSEKYFFDVIPSTVKKIAVLDRTKEPGAPGEPLYLDVSKLYLTKENRPIIVGGRYGLGSKDTRPSHIISVFENLKQEEPKNNFTIGIVDDVTNLSLPEGDIIETTPQGTISCKFWGLGSDGTVGANKSAIKIIGDNTDMYVQGYFSYDSKKSGGITVSHLRFGPKPLRSPYLVYNADYIACHNKSFIYNYDILKGLKKGGTFVLNCPWNEKELDEHLPAAMKRYIANNDIKFYVIDALKIASDIGLGNRINMVMQSAFFKLANIIPIEDAVKYLKDSIEKSYGKKGQKIVEMNNSAVDVGQEALIKVNVPESWKNASDEELHVKKDEPEFVKNIQRVMARNEGDDLPVSAFVGMEDGTHPLGTTAYEKRGIAPMIPEWQIDECIQCGQCSFVCPHSTVRLFLLNDEEKSRAPETFLTKKAIGKGFENLHFRVQISPLDCTGCGNCADVCPTKEKALIMKPAEEQIEKQSDNWEFAMTVTQKDNLLDRNTLKGSQLIRPLLEFNGACPGCGETPYVRLLTQLFGERMMIANATGCSSIWGASSPSIAYTTNAEGKGPAWANSLFEDNAEYGFGMYLGVKQIRARLADLMETAINSDIDEKVKNAFREWLDARDEAEGSKTATKHIFEALKDYDYKGNRIIEEIMEKKDYLIKKSFWMIGGDGWAYDIGYGGVDQVLSSGEDVNILVLDTEVYSNTGGQSSKATPTAAVAKFAAAGKRVRKKDLGLMAMSYGYVYVAQIAMGANMNQTVKAMVEAENYKGPSLIIAYSPCISHGIKTGMGTSIFEEKRAVEAGYWHLYRYNPMLKEQSKNPFILESKEPSAPYKDFLRGEIRYSQLMNVFPDAAGEMFDAAERDARERYETYKRMAEQKYS